MKCLILGWAVALSLAVFLIVPSAYAITVDDFSDDQGPILTSQNQTKTDGMTAPNAIAGSRSIRVTDVRSSIGSNDLKVTSLVNLGEFSHSQDATMTSRIIFTWDGDSDQNNLNIGGLGSVDFTQDGSTAFDFEVNSFDFANQRPMNVLITLYSGATNFSSGTVILSSQIASKTIKSLPFANFVVGNGALGSVDLTKIGAITLTLDAAIDLPGDTAGAPDADIRLDWVGTNACRRLPDNQGRVVDLCGVCGGNNTTCSDCLGIPNGPNVSGKSCPTGQPGVCAAGTWGLKATNGISCPCTPNTPPSSEICDEVDNDCDGEIDDGFSLKGQICSIGTTPCVSTGSYICSSGAISCTASPTEVAVCLSSRGCDGLPNSKKVLDVCGICGGDGSTCRGCDGVSGSGIVFDVCGLCGGNGKSCLDCNGTLNGATKLDACGVCGGDGKSCLNCTVVNLAPILTILDNGAKFQEHNVGALLKRLQKASLSSQTVRYIRETKKLAHELQIKNWVLTWTTIPVLNKNCDNKVLCQTLFNTPFLEEYRGRSKQLLDLALEVGRRIKSAQQGTLLSGDKALLKKAEKLHSDNVKLSFTVPETHEECGT